MGLASLKNEARTSFDDIAGTQILWPVACIGVSSITPCTIIGTNNERSFIYCNIAYGEIEWQTEEIPVSIGIEALLEVATYCDRGLFIENLCVLPPCITWRDSVKNTLGVPAILIDELLKSKSVLTV